MVKNLPTLKTDAEARDFVDQADLSEFDLAGFIPSREFFAKVEAARAHIREPAHKARAMKVAASAEKKVNMKYMSQAQAIRSFLEKAVTKRSFVGSKKPLIRSPDRKQKTEADGS